LVGFGLFVGSKNNFKSTTKQTLRSVAKESLISGSLHVFIFQSHYPNNPKKIPLKNPIIQTWKIIGKIVKIVPEQ